MFDREYDECDDDGASDLPTGYCANCGEECFGISVDNGIGAYEYWGSKGVHHQIGIESSCCNAALLEHSPKCLVCGSMEVEDEDLCLNCLNCKYPEAA